MSTTLVNEVENSPESAKKETELVTTIEKIIANELKQSAIFNLTLSARERSHSDFWKWIFEVTNDNTILKLFGIENNEDVKRVAREENNFDLLIETDKSFYIIENKFDSLHDVEQLARYSHKFNEKYPQDETELAKPCKFILITFHEDVFGSATNGKREGKIKNSKEITFKYEYKKDENNIIITIDKENTAKSYIWKTMTYLDFLNNLCKININDNTFIKEYKNVLINLLVLFKNIDFKAKTAPEFLEKLNICDIYEKIQTGYLFKEIKNRLDKNNVEYKNPHHYFMSGSGAITFEKYIDDKNLICQVTLQGDQLRREVCIKRDGAYHSKIKELIQGKSNLRENLLTSNFLSINTEKSKMRETYCQFGQKDSAEYYTIYTHESIEKLMDNDLSKNKMTLFENRFTQINPDEILKILKQ